MVIHVNIVDKRAAVAGAPVIVCGNSGYTVKFTFDDEWSGFGAKTARFVYVQAGAVRYQDVVFTGSTADVPVLANTKEVRIGVFAGDLRTTTPAVVPCELSIRCGTGAPADPTPSQYDQIMRLLTESGGMVTEAQIADAVENYLREHPVEGGAVTEEQIAAAVADYLTEHPVEGGTVTDEQIAAAVDAYLAKNPVAGKDGASAYEVWLAQGNAGTEEDFLDSLKGASMPGQDGASAYEIWLSQGYEGTEREFLLWLVGPEGYTPIKGTDYFDGKDGKAGADGISITSVKQTTTSTADGGKNVITVTLSNGKTSTFEVKNGSKGSTGAPGTDASVTANSIQSALGYTPAGATEVDQLSEKIEDETTARENAIADLKAQGVQQSPVYVDSEEEMTDTSKVYVMRDTNEIWAYKKTLVVTPESNSNVFVSSEALINQRLSSSGAISTTNGAKGSFVTGYIELTNWASTSAPYNMTVNFPLQSLALSATTGCFYDENKTFIGSEIYGNQDTGNPQVSFVDTSSVVKLKSGNATGYSNAKYLRIQLFKNVSGTALVASDLDGVVITLEANKIPASTTEKYTWASTGHTFTPADYENRIVELEEEVNRLTADMINMKNNAGGSGGTVVPEWWEDEVADTVAKIKALQAGKNCVTFPFFSDNHQRNGYAGVLIARVMKECGIPYAFYGGDAISSGFIPDEATMIAQDRAFDACMSYIPDGRFCRAVGNHDGFWKVSSTESYWYTREQVYDLFLREEGTAQNKHFGEDGTYYYVNDNVSKVRWIVLNIHSVDVDATQIAWFRDTALHFDESGWAVVIISHAPITRHYATLVYNADEVREVLKDYINSSSANKADVVGWWTGHVHRDRIFEGVAANPGYDGSTNTEEDMTNGDPIAEALPWKTVTIISDNVAIGYGGVKHAVDDSDQSHAIDFVTINKGTKTVNITRLGFGSDRSFTY